MSPGTNTPLPTTLTSGIVPAVLRPGYLDPTRAASPTTGVTARWAPEIQAASAATGVPAPLLHAVIRAESSGNSDAKSPAGAIGLMQLLPGTAAGLGVTNPLDPGQNIMGGAKYLAALHKHFGDWTQTVAAYNAGPDATEARPGKRIGPFAQSHTDPRYKVWQAPFNTGFTETQNYVKNISDDVNSRPIGGQ